MHQLKEVANMSDKDFNIVLSKIPSGASLDGVTRAEETTLADQSVALAAKRSLTEQGGSAGVMYTLSSDDEENGKKTSQPGIDPLGIQTLCSAQASKVKAILKRHLQLLKSDEDQYSLEPAAAQSDQLQPKPLCLPSGDNDYEAKYRSEMVVGDLCRIQEFLKKDLIDKARVLYYIEKAIKNWTMEFEEPHPHDLTTLMSDLTNLKKHLTGEKVRQSSTRASLQARRQGRSQRWMI